MKLKKLYMSFTCYLTLIAFVGIISIEVSAHSYFLIKKTEVSSSKTNVNSNLNMIIEEEIDADDLIDYSFLSQVHFIGNSLTFFQTNYYNSQSNYRLIYKTNSKSPLYKSLRVLRI